MARLWLMSVLLALPLLALPLLARAACAPDAAETGAWTCRDGATTAAALAAVVRAGTDVGCVRATDAADAAEAVPQLGRYYADYAAAAAPEDRARLGEVVRAANGALGADGEDALLWLEAVYALHVAFPTEVRFAPACLPWVRYADASRRPAGVGAVPDVRAWASAQAAAAALAPHPVAAARHGAWNETSRCNATAELVECDRLEGSVVIGTRRRSFLWQTPLGTPPAGGWPAVIHYHGSFGAPHVFSWRATPAYPFGLYWQALTVKQLLDVGYAVVTPESHLSGFLFWDTNLPVWRQYWERAPDNEFVLWLLDEMGRGANGTFGPLDAGRFYAAGLSSGAYMTSRMATNYNGRFRALAIHSGSYATCAGPICSVPTDLPSDHPPTLFLHGEADLIVGIDTMERYAAQMVVQGIEHRKVIDPVAGHEWIAQAVDEVPIWFDTHP